MLLLAPLVIVLVLFVVTQFYFQGEDLSQYQQPRPEVINAGVEPSEAHGGIVAFLTPTAESRAKVKQLDKNARLLSMREGMDKFGKTAQFEGKIIPVDYQGIKGEWLVPPNANVQNRMLYIHGGAFLMGSPVSHRPITAHYARLIGGPVFALDYRLLPEHQRQASIDDSRAAYQWILEQGPEGAANLNNLYVSGDSAGGNLALALSLWVRDKGLRAPQAVVALAPVTDSTYTSPSLTSNVKTDVLLSPLAGALAKYHQSLLVWFTAVTYRIRPADPSISPVFGDLSNLPPTLIHASSNEMLLDDSVRFANKARAAGSPVTLKVWHGLLHVWHMFVDTVPEAQQAFADIEQFLKQHSR
ncbi:alpha/beta hydrolase [Oceanicoccus sagamiensis]|uniref:Alpha/beta hydrolase fold-3 domain-containing protein n=1 Tax=Oceanicoccus sagamiensis TaxID=716816 RepID=A0A1X9NDV6_9GAMM|nr:alpha/beta hydrolase [Oceanicoccus sagamiensis]ARN76220.1 hypothetical protein BST96_20200 [Oceanicoccus sagamiensis]